MYGLEDIIGTFEFYLELIRGYIIMFHVNQMYDYPRLLISRLMTKTTPLLGVSNERGCDLQLHFIYLKNLKNILPYRLLC